MIYGAFGSLVLTGYGRIMMKNDAVQIKYKTNTFLIESEARIGATEIAAAKASKGDKEALAQLCDQIAKSVLFRMSKMLNNHVDAEDAAQEVLIRVCKSIGQLKNPKTFRKWLGTIIVNEARRKGMQNAKMSEKVIHLSSLPEVTIDDDDNMLPEQFAVNAENRRTVMGAIDKLPQRQREAIMLHYYDRLNVTETAEAMGISQPAASIHIKEACSRIKRDLEASSKELIKTMHGLLMIPFGEMLSDVLYTEGTLFVPQNQTWMAETIAKCGDFALAGAAVSGGAAVGGVVGNKKVNMKLSNTAKIAKVLLTVVIASTVTLAITFCAIVWHSAQQTGGSLLNASGSVVFSGDHAVKHINPTGASAVSDSEHGELTVHHWEIQTSDGNAVLFYGKGNAVTEDIFLRMHEEGHTGDFEMVFILEDAVGIKYELAHNFFLFNDE